MDDISQSALPDAASIAGYNFTGHNGTASKNLPIATLISGLIAAMAASEAEAEGLEEPAAFISPATLLAALEAFFTVTDGFLGFSLGGVSYRIPVEIVE